jgi:hypothetical protein
MSSRSFRSVFMVASCASAALGCYMVSLRVASERAQLEDVESHIVLAQRDMRVLQTEIGTRGRLSQLERWNAGAFALSAPSADQFVKGGFELARLAQPDRKVEFKEPVYLASAPAPQRAPLSNPQTDDSGAPAPSTDANSLLHQASLKIGTREVPARPVAMLPQATARSTDEPANAAKPAFKTFMEKSGLAAAHLAKRGTAKPVSVAMKVAPKKSVDKPKVVTAQAMTKPVRLAKVDPLAPLAGKHFGHSKDAAAE